MKKLKKLIALFCTVLLFVSCSTDLNGSEVDRNADAQNLIGTWLLTEITQEGNVSTEFQGVPVTGTVSSFGKDIDAQIIFTGNPDNYTTSGGYTDVITVNIIGQTIDQEQNISINDILGQGSWTLNQGILALTQNSDTRSANIIELTSSRLKIEIEITETLTLQGTSGAVNSILSMTLSKQ